MAPRLASDQDRTPSRFRLLVGLAALFGCLRMVLLGLALPPLAPLDEHAHVDTAWRYARCELPTIEKEHYLPESADFGARYLHPEWFSAKPEETWWPDLVQAVTGNRPDGYWPLTGILVEPELLARRSDLEFLTTPAAQSILQGYVERESATYRTALNYELFEPPLYYVGAGLWQNLSPLRSTMRHDFAWLRAFSALCFGAGVLLFALLARVITKNTTTAVLVAWLCACTPQDVFGVVKSDVLGPILYPGIALLAFWVRARTDLLRCVSLGVGIALVWLGKPAFVPALLGVPFILGRPVWRRLRRRSVVRFRAVWAAVGAIVPVALWSAWSVAESGDATGANHKVGIMNFKPQTWEGFSTHPIWSVEGAWTFFNTTITRLWRGEITWHGRELSFVAADRLFLLLTLVATGVGIRLAFAGPNGRQRVGSRALLVQWLGALGLLFALSLLWDMRDARTHMRGFPYFANGRLIFGAFGALSIFLCDGAVRRFGERTATRIVTVLAIGLVIFGVFALEPVLRSQSSLWRLL